jgi:hypothetical protein
MKSLDLALGRSVIEVIQTTFSFECITGILRYVWSKDKYILHKSYSMKLIGLWILVDKDSSLIKNL